MSRGKCWKSAKKQGNSTPVTADRGAVPLFLHEMHVGEDVILTVAVVAGALAAVAEGHVGIVGVRLAAHAALVVITLLLLLLPAPRPVQKFSISTRRCLRPILWPG